MPSGVFPFLKATEPVITGPLAVVTVAVNVTGWPNDDGFSELVSVVVVSTGKLKKLTGAS